MKVTFFFIRTKRNGSYNYIVTASPDQIYSSIDPDKAFKSLTRETAVKYYEDNEIFKSDLDYSVVTETREIDPIHLFNMFALNYPHNFITSVWGEFSQMSRHLNSKFSTAYDKAGTSGVMLKFWCELDTKNREKLQNWILENYNG